MNYTANHNKVDDPLGGDYRYEIKFALAETAMPMLMSWVRSHPAGFATAYPPRQVNSLYFDTHDWASLSEGLAGLAVRGKLRLRWYGPNIALPDGVLELKHKRGALGKKISHRMAPIDLSSSRWHQILHTMSRRDLGPLSAIFAANCCPALLNHYQRQYFISADHLVRLTVDTDLAAYDQTVSLAPNLHRRRPTGEIVVMELKGQARHGRRISEVAAQLPLRSTAFSKYATGVCGMGALGTT